MLQPSHVSREAAKRITPTTGRAKHPVDEPGTLDTESQQSDQEIRLLRAGDGDIRSSQRTSTVRYKFVVSPLASSSPVRPETNGESL